MNIYEALNYAKNTGNRVKSSSGEVYWWDRRLNCIMHGVMIEGCLSIVPPMSYLPKDVMSNDWQKVKVKVRLINPVMGTLLNPVIIRGQPDSVIVTCDDFEQVEE